MKLIVISVVLLALSSSIFAQTVEWKPFSSSPDGFAVEFPGTPKLNEEKDQGFTHRKFISY